MLTNPPNTIHYTSDHSRSLNKSSLDRTQQTLENSTRSIISLKALEQKLDNIFGRHETTPESMSLRGCLYEHQIALSKLKDIGHRPIQRLSVMQRNSLSNDVKSMIKSVDLYIDKIEQKYEQITQRLEENTSLDYELATREMWQIVEIANHAIEKIQYDASLKIAKASQAVNEILYDTSIDTVLKFFNDPINTLKTVVINEETLEKRLGDIDNITENANKSIHEIRSKANRDIDSAAVLLEQRIARYEDISTLKEEVIAALKSLKFSLNTELNRIQSYDIASCSLKYIRRGFGPARAHD